MFELNFEDYLDGGRRGFKATHCVPKSIALAYNIMQSELADYHMLYLADCTDPDPALSTDEGDSLAEYYDCYVYLCHSSAPQNEGIELLRCPADNREDAEDILRETADFYFEAVI